MPDFWKEENINQKKVILYERLSRDDDTDTESNSIRNQKIILEDYAVKNGMTKPRFASLRGTYGDCSFRMDCAGSDKRYGFNMAARAPSECLYVFESPIDAMSHASLAIAEFGDKTAWEYDRRLSLAGTSDTALPSFLNQHPTVKELVFCLDNDPAGREASALMARKYAEKGYHTRIMLPVGKDFNEDLQARLKQIQTEKRAVFVHRDADI